MSLFRLRRGMLAASLLACVAHVYASDSEDLYQQAVRAYQQHQYQQAIQLFDAVIAANPNHAGAMLDRAISLYENGDLGAAEDSFRQLAQLTDVPPAIGELVQHYLEALATPPEWNLQQTLQLQAGRSNNANQGLGSNQFEFGLLDPYYLARPDHYTDLQYIADGQRLSDNHRRYALVYHRQFRQEHEANQTLLLAGSSWQWPLTRGKVQLDAQLGHHRQDNRTLYNSAGLGLAWQQPLLAGQFQLGSQWQLRHQSGAGYNGNTQAQLAASYRQSSSGWLWQLEYSLSQDRPQTTRPGGTRYRHELALQSQYLLGPRWLLQGEISRYREQQTEAFSPLFGELRRRDHSTRAQLGLSWALAGNQRLTLSWQAQDLRSNISLYSVAHQEWALGWQQVW